MTELAASAIALMLDVELAVAIACAAKWFELRRARERRSARQAEAGGWLWPGLLQNTFGPPSL
jgi:hypothetical protein